MIIFYDSYCPLCCAEMAHLKKRDHQQRIELVDINEEGFSGRYPELNWQALNSRIHAQLDNGEIVTGLDATHAVWKAVGRGWLYAPLRWPVIRYFADAGYKWFARHRYTISWLLTGKRRTCGSGTCKLPGDAK